MEGEPLLRQDRLYKHEDWYLAKYLHTIAEQDPQIIVTGAVDICCLFSFVLSYWRTGFCGSIVNALVTLGLQLSNLLLSSPLLQYLLGRSTVGPQF